MVQPLLAEADQSALVMQHWQAMARVVNQIPVDHAPTAAALDQRVKPEWASFHQLRDAVRRYESAVPLEAPGAEFVLRLRHAIAARKHYLQRLIAPQTTREAVFDTCHFEDHDRIVAACFMIMATALQTQADLHASVRLAVQAMRQAMFEGLAWQTGAMQEHPLAEVREWGNILFSGVMRSMIHMHFPGLRDALAQEGNPEKVLLARLPATVYACWYEGSRESLAAIRNRVVRVLKQHDNQDPREDRAQLDALAPVPGDTLSLAPDDALRLLELEDLVKAQCRQVHCTAYETAVVCLKWLEYSEREIAGILDHSEDGVTQALRSARNKLKTVAGPEEMKRLIM
jgi:hypothetical protein